MQRESKKKKKRCLEDKLNKDVDVDDKVENAFEPKGEQEMFEAPLILYVMLSTLLP
jgi:hypothetical protein